MVAKVEIDSYLKKKTILIVEDDEPSFKLLETLLISTTANIIWVKDGRTSVEHCNDNTNIDLVLMDINLPILNGHDATREIKKFRPKLPIIAQTAFAIPGSKEEALDAGCDDFIIKPIKKKLLMEMIDKWLI